MKPTKFKILYFSLIIATLNFAFCALNLSPAHAQTNRSFTVSPPSLKFSLKPGSKTEKQIKVTNQSAGKLDFVVNTEDFVVTNKEGTPELLPPGTLPSNRFSASSWSTALPPAFSLEPGKSQTVTLYLQVPTEASPGGRYFAVAIKPVGAGGVDQGAAVNTVIGTLVYLTVEGPVTEKAQVVNFTAPRFSEFGPIEFLTEIRNLGDIHLAPQATVEVKNLFGQKVYSFALDNLNIFPGTIRIYKNSWEKRWLFGPFIAKLAGSGGKNNPLIAQTTFWVIPYRLIISVILVLVIIIFGLLYLKRRFRPQVIQE